MQSVTLPRISHLISAVSAGEERRSVVILDADRSLQVSAGYRCTPTCNMSAVRKRRMRSSSKCSQKRLPRRKHQRRKSPIEVRELEEGVDVNNRCLVRSTAEEVSFEKAAGGMKERFTQDDEWSLK